MSSLAANPEGPRLAIRARNLSKQYQLGEMSTLLRFSRRLLGGRGPRGEQFSALNGVDLEIVRGECLGIVGDNGSGKSTFLQIVSGITMPTSGELEIWGRVLPLLAVGSGFHPELTGRENAELVGTILGVPRPMILDRLSDIAAFAEIQRHFDTPVKRYSDGMQARLSFALAVLFPADIYIFDEVLAVVDQEYRARCLAEIASLSEAGSTVIIVSHDLDQIRQRANRVLWMDAGAVRMLGESSEVLGAYEDARFASPAQVVQPASADAGG